MHNTATRQDRSLKTETLCSFLRKISGHSSKQQFPFLILLISKVLINQILGSSYFSLRKFDLFSLVSLQTMIEMGMAVVKREEDGQVGGGKKLGR